MMDKILGQMVNLTDELFSFVDQNYCYQEVNNAYLRLFNRKREEYIGKHVACVMGENQFLVIKEMMDRCLAGEIVSYERWFEFSKKKRYYLIVTYTPYKVHDDILGIIVSVKNYTQQKLSEDEKAKNQELLIHHAKMAELGSMASFLNHQWRSPLNTLSANLLKLKVLADEHGKQTPFHQTLLRCEEILEQISDDLEVFRDFYNPNKRIETINLEDAIKQVLTFLEERIHALDVSLSMHIMHEIELKCLKSDLLHLLMIFFNNALDAFERRCTVSPMLDIRARLGYAYISISIEDNAGGIDEAILDQIFVNFVSTKAYKQGSGMGLYFARMIAKEKLKAQLSLKEGKQGLKIILEIPKIS